jgi:hypothetical protein
MDEITLDDKTYVSSKRAAQITGYAKDYVGQLCREGRVEARLVGRNWYVLEASIRAHRFGSEEKSEVGSEIDGGIAWQPSNYSSEAPSEPIPLVIPQQEAPQINILEGRNPGFTYEKPEIPEVSSKVVKEMQSAWHDWFAKTNELSVSQEILLEKHVESDSTPVTLEKVTEVIEKNEVELEPKPESVFGEQEAVQIHRTFTAPEPVQAPVAQEITPTRIYGASREIPSHMYQPIPSEGRVIHERRIPTRRKPNTALKAVLLIIAVAIIVVTVVSSGFLDTFLSQHNVHYAPIQYLVGQSTVIKPSK